jgi:hypothetical protein
MLAIVAALQFAAVPMPDLRLAPALRLDAPLAGVTQTYAERPPDVYVQRDRHGAILATGLLVAAADAALLTTLLHARVGESFGSDRDGWRRALLGAGAGLVLLPPALAVFGARVSGERVGAWRGFGRAFLLHTVALASFAVPFAGPFILLAMDLYFVPRTAMRAMQQAAFERSHAPAAGAVPEPVRR